MGPHQAKPKTKKPTECNEVVILQNPGRTLTRSLPTDVLISVLKHLDWFNIFEDLLTVSWHWAQTIADYANQTDWRSLYLNLQDEIIPHGVNINATFWNLDMIEDSPLYFAAHYKYLFGCRYQLHDVGDGWRETQLKVPVTGEIATGKTELIHRLTFGFRLPPELPPSTVPFIERTGELVYAIYKGKKYTITLVDTGPQGKTHPRS